MIKMRTRTQARFIYCGLLLAYALFLACVYHYLLDGPHAAPATSSEHTSVLIQNGMLRSILPVYLLYEVLTLLPALFCVFVIFRFNILGQHAIRVYLWMPTLIFVISSFGLLVTPSAGLLTPFYIFLAFALLLTGNAGMVYLVRDYFRRKYIAETPYPAPPPVPQDPFK